MKPGGPGEAPVPPWPDVRRVFEQALDRPAGDRAAFVGEATADHPQSAALATAVQRLLSLHDADERDGPVTPPATGDLLAALRAAPSAPLTPGACIGSWRLLSRLGAGAMGEVWEAEQSRPRRRAALKLLRSGLPGTRARLRFHDEIDALARLRHPGIARILEAGEVDESDGAPRPWYAMELVPGARALGAWAAGQSLDWRAAVRLLVRVCAAVEHGHRHGVIHRDLKPDNILVGDDGQPRLIDFGVARLVAAGDLAGRTQAGEFVGTLASMAPEQFDGRADVRSDVYGLGVVLYELLTGRPPHVLDGLGLTEAAARVRSHEPRPPSAERDGLPIELDWIVGKALEKDPEARYATAAALADDLERLLADEPVRAGAPGAGYRVRKFARRHRVGVGLALTFVLLLTVGSVGTTVGMLRAWEGERAAQQARDLAERRQEQALAAQTLAEQRQREAQEAATQEAAARAREAAAHTDAESSAQEARAVTRFLVDLFQRADPALDGSEVRVIDALDTAEERMGAFLAEHPRAEATLRSALGRLDHALGRYEQAAAQLRRALDVQRSRGLHDDEGQRVELELRHDLGQTLCELRRFDEADVELQAVVEARRARPGDDVTALPDALAALAYLRHLQGRLDDAEALDTEALALLHDAGQANGLEAARVQANLGGLLLERRELVACEPLLLAALDTLRAQLGPDHPLVVTVLNNLSGLRFHQHRDAEAAELMQQVYELRRQRLPPDHPVLLQTEANLATLRWALGQPELALDMLEGLIAKRERLESTTHPELITMRCNQVNMLHSRGEDAVRAGVQRLLAAGVGSRADDLRSVTPLENLASTLERWGMLPEALALLDEALRARDRLLPVDDPGTREVRDRRERLAARVARAPR